MEIKLAVIVSDYGAAVNIGGGVQTTVRIFPLSDEAKSYINLNMSQWKNVTLAIQEEHTK
jgi:hypothetical protein